MARLTAEALKTKPKRPADVMQGDGSFVETRPSKGELVWSILGPYITEPAAGALNWTRNIMNADPYTLLTDTGPRAQALAEGGAEVATNFMGAGSVASKPAGAITAGLGRPDKKPLTADAMKTVWSDLSKTKHPIPVEDMRAVVEPTNTLLPRKTVSPESLQGSILVPAVGDRTAAGGILRQINDIVLQNGVPLEGGPDFMRSLAQAKDQAIWASDKGVIKRLVGHAQKLAEAGKPINKVYSAMGARSGDFSTMMSDAILNQIPGSKILKKTIKEFDAELKTKMADWPGLLKANARDVLNANGEARKAFAETAALGKYQERGFPDIGSTRAAISEPALLGQPTGVSGYAISRVDPEAGIISSPSVPHSTYNTQMAGTYLGGLENHIPREVMFPSFYKERRAQNLPAGADDRAFSMSNVSQNADQEWLDGIMGYLARLNAR